MKLTPLTLVISTFCYSLPAFADERYPAFSPLQKNNVNAANIPFLPEPSSGQTTQEIPELPLLAQVSRQTGEGIKQLGKMIARSSWFDEINPATSGLVRSNVLAGNNSHHLWYYRLQNVVVTGEPDNGIPQLIDTPEGVTPAPDPGKGEAVILPPPPPPEPEPPQLTPAPQIPTYLALPNMLYALNDAMQTRFHFAAQQMSLDDHHNLFVYGYSGGERYRSVQGDSDATSRYQGWMLGARWTPEAEQSPLAFSAGVHKGVMTMLSNTAAGRSQLRMQTQGINALIGIQPPEGWQLEIPLGLTHYRGTLRHETQGEVARISAVSGNIGAEAGWRWQQDTHSLMPLAAAGVQWLHVADFTEQQGAQVNYQLAPQFSLAGGVKYDYQPLSSVKIGLEARYVWHSGRQNTLDAGDMRGLPIERARHSAQLGGYVSWQLHENVEIGTQLQVQQRLDRPGVSDWNVLSGVKVAF